MTSTDMTPRESEVLRGYVLLVKQMLINVLDRIRIKNSWKRNPKRISARMLEKKERQLAELGDWLDTDGAKFWFRMYGLSTGTVWYKTLRNFRKFRDTSRNFIKNVKLQSKK